VIIILHVPYRIAPVLFSERDVKLMYVFGFKLSSCPTVILTQSGASNTFIVISFSRVLSTDEEGCTLVNPTVTVLFELDSNTNASFASE